MTGTAMFKTLTPSSLSPTKPSLFMKLSGLPSLSSKLFASAFDEKITSDRQSARLVTRLVYFARFARQRLRLKTAKRLRTPDARYDRAETTHRAP